MNPHRNQPPYIKTPPAAAPPESLEDRIAAIRSEIEAIIEERAQQVLDENPGQPLAVIKMMLGASAPDCLCSQYLLLDRQNRA